MYVSIIKCYSKCKYENIRKLSNFHIEKFVLENIEFKSGEHCFHYFKICTIAKFCIYEKRFNEPLLNPEKTKHIYVYRKKENEYLWYGKYEIFEKNIKSHIGKDNLMRNIIVLTLKKINDIN